jgi:hypothetical protein
VFDAPNIDGSRRNAVAGQAQSPENALWTGFGASKSNLVKVQQFQMIVWISSFPFWVGFR